MDDILKALSVDVHRAARLPHSALESLRRAWRALESAARSPVRSSDDSLRVAPRPNDNLDPRAISRWEDDGGYVPRHAWRA